MKMKHILTVLCLTLYCNSHCYCSHVQISSAAVSAVALYIGFIFKGTFHCYFFECCKGSWIRLNKTELDAALNSKVYGQPLVQRISDAIQDHWSSQQPQKALAIALHGPTGTGKNYAVRILADSLFRHGTRSRFYHFYSAAVHFPHSHLLATYTDQLNQWVSGNVSLCPQSVFVFDEVDKLPVKLLDTLKPFVDYHEHISGVDYRRAIFIFLSNSGSELIMRKMVELKRLGKSRDSPTMIAEFDRLLSSHVYSDASSALSDSALLKHHLVSRFVPFLPLERQHVIGCVQDFLRVSWPSALHRRRLIDKVLMLLPFVPLEEKFFSSAGCKRVVDKTLMVLHE